MGTAQTTEWLPYTQPQHQVTVNTFQMAKTLVTNKQYRACVRAGACTPSLSNLPPWYERDTNPVVGVDWNQAKAFSEWVGGRLPSEAEWEYAARSGGKDWTYPWGDDAATCEMAVIKGCTPHGGTPVPVCSKPAGNTTQGLCDMAGNVWQWVQDWYHESYLSAPTDGSAWENPAGYDRAVRGGSYESATGDARSALRIGRAPNRPDYTDQGFRPVRAISPQESLPPETANVPPEGTPAVTRHSKHGIEWVAIPGGTFTMGSGNGNEGPAHSVTLKPFQLAKTLVTNEQYKACMQAGACTAPKEFGERFKGDDQPVVGVDWHQSEAFAKWAGGRLPSEAQWEYAARSGGTATFPPKTGPYES